MTEAPKKVAAYDYRVLKESDDCYHVFVVHDNTEEWWRHLATFRSFDRACDYAEIENHGKDDALEYGYEKDDVKQAPETLPATPASVAIAANMNPPTPAEKARVASALLSEAAAETGQEVTVSVKPLTDKMERVWRAMIALEKDRNPDPTLAQISNRADVALGSMGYLIDCLIDRGYCERDGIGRLRARRADPDEIGAKSVREASK